MPRRRLSYEAAAAGAIRDLHPEPRRRVKAALEAARDEPHLGKELRDELAGLRSLRIGRLRIIYREARGAIQVIDVGPRDTIYEDLARRLLRGQRRE